MRRVTVLCKLERTFASSEQPCRQRRQTVSTLHNERDQKVAEHKDSQTSPDRHRSASGVGDANASNLDTLIEPESESSISPESRKGRADEYNLQKARLHAKLWQQEIKKHLGESVSVEENADCGSSSGWDPQQITSEGWESFDPVESHYYDGDPMKEEAMMLEEFEKRRERNRMQIASFVKQHLYGRRRPVDGWKYILNNFGKNDRAGGSASTGEGQRQGTGNELEKLASKGEGGRFRRKD